MQIGDMASLELRFAQRVRPLSFSVHSSACEVCSRRCRVAFSQRFAALSVGIDDLRVRSTDDKQGGLGLNRRASESTVLQYS